MQCFEVKMEFSNLNPESLERMCDMGTLVCIRKPLSDWLGGSVRKSF
jgi:hypothetical protein